MPPRATSHGSRRRAARATSSAKAPNASSARARGRRGASRTGGASVAAPSVSGGSRAVAPLDLLGAVAHEHEQPERRRGRGEQGRGQYRERADTAAGRERLHRPLAGSPAAARAPGGGADSGSDEEAEQRRLRREVVPCHQLDVGRPPVVGVDAGRVPCESALTRAKYAVPARGRRVPRRREAHERAGAVTAPQRGLPRRLGDLRLEQREPLREDRVLVGEPRDHRRVVQQHERG